MRELRGLCGDGGGDLRVRVAHRGHGDARSEVDERVPVRVDDDSATGGDGRDGHGVADTGGDGIRLACQDLGRAGPGEFGDQTTLLRELGSAEGNCNSCGVEECHARERTAAREAAALTALYNLE